VQWRLHQPSFALYLGQPTELRPPRQGELALVRLDRLPPAQPPELPATASAGLASPDLVAPADAAVRAAAPAPARWRLVHQGQGYGLLLWLAAEPASDTP
jgi:hypothetical protein